jgi:quercetin dioxygenase-like cupin family protein
MAGGTRASDGRRAMPDVPTTSGPDPQAPLPRILCDAQALAAQLPTSAGALWKLEEPGRQLDANLVHLSPHQRVDAHVEPDLDVLLLVVTGKGTLSATDHSEPLTPGVLIWLPHGSARSLSAGPDGLSYLTVHRRRPGMQIQPRPNQATAPLSPPQ